MPVLDITMTKSEAVTVASNGAGIQVQRLGGEAGPSMLACACSGEFLAALTSPVFSMRLRGYEGSKVS